MTPTEQQQTEPGREREGSESDAAGVIVATEADRSSARDLSRLTVTFHRPDSGSRSI